ncbi:MAG: cholesterol catabolism transcriptional regulator KstR [Nocardioides sp.]|nr:cholesterol catabolism transcriptional regulator KstR [Nocardioides sp.]
MATLSSLSQEELGSAAQRERRRRILDATIALASKGGFDAVQMRAVAEKADVALGTLYRYFPSKIHLLVSALGREFERAQAGFDQRTLTGETAADRVIHVLNRNTRGMQREPQLTEALTRAFMFADSSVANEIHIAGMYLTDMLTRAMKGPEGDDAEPTEENIAIAKVIGDVWMSNLVAWVTGRASAADVSKSMDVAVRLILR